MEAVLEIVGVNGDSVVLTGPETGRDGFWLASELEGFLDPESEAVTKSFGNRPGSRFVSSRIVARTIVFNVTVANDGEWEERDARWRRLWSYNDYSELRITTSGGTRSLHARLEEIEVDTTYDPHVNEVTDLTMTVVADDPFWYAPDYTISFAGSQTLEIPTLNPTSNPVFPVWVLEGGAQWTIPSSWPPGETITLPELLDGEDVVVNTDPGKRQLVSDTGTPVWQRMNGVRFQHPIPAYSGSASVPVAVSVEGKQGQLRIPRPYSRPWGGV